MNNIIPCYCCDNIFEKSLIVHIPYQYLHKCLPPCPICVDELLAEEVMLDD